MKRNFLKIVVLISLLGLTSVGGIVFAEESKTATAFDNVIKKMYGNDSAEKNKRPIPNGGVKAKESNLKAEMMKESLSPEMLKMMGIDNPDGKEISPSDAVQMGILQQLEILRDQSQYQVENLLRLQLITDPNDQDNYFIKLPWIIPYTATLIRDKDAIPEIFSIWFQHKSELGIFFVFVISTLFLSRLICKLYNQNVSVLASVGRFFIRMFTMQCLRLIVFVYIFYSQLGPFGRLTKTFIFNQLK
ncbi:MAG: hypothetical protein KAG61_12790 [Bacteriovoracaceae bacterium]|nr:hypothetical protein [Bacteriovoracaceae bacterium]